jgi:hypothetical protein
MVPMRQDPEPFATMAELSNNQDTSFTHSLFPGAIQSVSSQEFTKSKRKRQRSSSSNIFNDFSSPRPQSSSDTASGQKSPSPTYSPEKFKYTLPESYNSVSVHVDALAIPGGPASTSEYSDRTWSKLSKELTRSSDNLQTLRGRQKSVLKFQKLSLPIRFPSPTKSNFSNKDSVPSLFGNSGGGNGLFVSPTKSADFRSRERRPDDDLGWDWESPDEEHQRRVLWGIQTAQSAGDETHEKETHQEIPRAWSCSEADETQSTISASI